MRELLIVEDSEEDYFLTLATLKRQGIQAQCERVEDEVGMRAALARKRFDAVISDHNLPNFSSFGALACLRASSQSALPFIIVSGEIGEDLAVQAMREGADDYLLKGRLARLSTALEQAIERAALRRENTLQQQRLAQSEAKLAALSAHLQHAVERERGEIGRELHDDVGGQLTALRFDLDWIERHSEGDLKARALRALGTADEALHAARRILRSLRPPVLDQGVVAALQWQVRSFTERFGVRAALAFNAEPRDLDPDIALTLLRAGQEALTNIAKHAQATEVALDFVDMGDEVSLEIADNGIGIAADALAKPESFGISGLRERIRALGGEMDLISETGALATRGTTLIVTLPRRPGGSTDTR
jgi:signal transduction histidine kinase